MRRVALHHDTLDALVPRLGTRAAARRLHRFLRAAKRAKEARLVLSALRMLTMSASVRLEPLAQARYAMQLWLVLPDALNAMTLGIALENCGRKRAALEMFRAALALAARAGDGELEEDARVALARCSGMSVRATV